MAEPNSIRTGINAEEFLEEGNDVALPEAKAQLGRDAVTRRDALTLLGGASLAAFAHTDNVQADEPEILVSLRQQRHRERTAGMTPDQLLRHGLMYVDAPDDEQIREFKRAFQHMLRSRDTSQWEALIKEEGSAKNRQSFVAEAIAYSGQFTQRPVEGVEPVILSDRLHIHIVAYQPDADAKTGQPLPKQHRDNTYLIMRYPRPRSPQNPFSVLFAAKVPADELLEVRTKLKELH